MVSVYVVNFVGRGWGWRGKVMDVISGTFLELRSYQSFEYYEIRNDVNHVLFLNFVKISPTDFKIMLPPPLRATGLLLFFFRSVMVIAE